MEAGQSIYNSSIARGGRTSNIKRSCSNALASAYTSRVYFGSIIYLTTRASPSDHHATLHRWSLALDR